MTCNCGNDGTPEYYITLDGVGINGFSPTVDFINSLPASFQIQVTDVDGVETSDAVPKLSYITGNYVSNDTLASTLANYSTSSEIASTYLSKSDAATTYLEVDGSNANNPITINNVSLRGYSDGTGKISTTGTLQLHGSNTNIYGTSVGINVKANSIDFGNWTYGGKYLEADTTVKYGTSSTKYEIATVNDIPTVSDATITLTQGGVTKGAFTLNGSATTIDLDAGSAITNPLVITNQAEDRTLSLGIDDDTNKVIFDYNIGGVINVPIPLLYSATSPLVLTERSADGLYTLSLDYDTSTLGLDASNKLTVIGGGGTTYTAGTGIDITSDVISIDTSVVAQLSDIPTSSDYVDLTTNQTVGGVKTFSDELHLNDNIVFGSSLNAASIIAKSGTSDRSLIIRNNATSIVHVGNTYDALTLRGSSTRPTYYTNASSKDLALYDDIPSLTNYVTNTDYAGTATAGVVKVDGSTVTIDANGVISASGGIQNTATGTNSLTILGTATSSSSTINIGTGSSAVGYSVVIGNDAYNSYQYDTVIGYGAHAGSGDSGGGSTVVIGDNTYSQRARSVTVGSHSMTENEGSIAIGYYASASGNSSGMYPAIAIGYNAAATASNAIQLGEGNNSTIDTFAVGFNGTNYTLLDGATGLIPDARISSNIARSANVPTSEDIEAHKAYEDAGELLTDAEGLAYVTKYAYSSFDIGKFTVVGSPTITTDGIVSDFSSSNYLVTPNITFTSGKTWEIVLKFNLTNISNADSLFFGNSNDMIVLRSAGYFQINTSGGSAKFQNYIFSPNKDYIVKLSFNGERDYSISGENLTDGTTISTQTIRLASWFSNTARAWNIGYASNSSNIRGSIDLKRFLVKVDGALVFSGNKTGTDTYSIGGNTVTIPYTLSKTNSKIVESTYRTQVSSVYAAVGSAPYYTLLEGTNYTLPQGELYGMIGIRALVESYRNGIQYYEVYSDGTIEQGGSCSANTAVTFLKPFKDTNYVVTVPYSSKTATGFTPTQGGDWIAKGIGA